MSGEQGNVAAQAEPADIHGRFTIADLAGILEVSPARLRNWVRLGLLEPAVTVCRLSWFDFEQAALAKRLWELVGQGASIASIRRGLARLRSWLPGEELTLAQVARLEQSGQLLIRLDDKLLDASGQQHFDFSATDEPSAGRNSGPRPAIEDLFDVALAHEDAGRLEEAAAAYAEALAGEPFDPVLHFNLGNVWFGLGRYAEAWTSYEQALRFDPYYAEAWNNLGLVLARLDKLSDALSALRRALQLVPTYSTAQRNLAELASRTSER